MSGICGVRRRYSQEHVSRTIGAMANGLLLDTRVPVITKTAGEAAVGAASRFGTQQVYANERSPTTCDAELYDEPDLRASVDCDASVGTAGLLVALYERFGTAFASRLDGAFSFILWDRHRRCLIAGVDGFGIHRLAYYQDGNTLAIASRLDAFLQSGIVRRDLDPRGVANFMNYGVNLAPEHFLRGSRGYPREPAYLHGERCALGTILGSSIWNRRRHNGERSKPSA